MMMPNLKKIAFARGPGKSTALLSAFHNGLSAPLSAFRPMLLLQFPPQCYINVLPAGGEGEVRRQNGKYGDVSGK
jgi:hypothetical protein